MQQMNYFTGICLEPHYFSLSRLEEKKYCVALQKLFTRIYYVFLRSDGSLRINQVYT